MLIAVNPSSNFNCKFYKFFRFKKIFILRKNKKKCLFNDKFFMSIEGYVTDKNDKKLSKKFIFNKFCDLRTNSDFLAFVKTLGGAFGIFLFDVQKKKTYLFKDEDGYQPLFYNQIKDSLVISSNIRQLKNITKIKAKKINFLMMVGLKLEMLPL